MAPQHKPEIKLLTGFVRDLRRLPKSKWDLAGPPYWECETIEGTLQRRLPGVRAAVAKAGVRYCGPLGETPSFDFLADPLEPKTRPAALRILEQAIGIFQHGLVPACAIPTGSESCGAPAQPEPPREVSHVSAYQRELELLTTFASDLKRLHAISPAPDGTLPGEGHDLRDSLNRRLPVVRRAIERTEVPRHGRDMASGRFDYLDLMLEQHVFTSVWTILQQAIGVFENDMVPADIRTREEETARRREEEERKPLPRVTQDFPLPPSQGPLPQRSMPTPEAPSKAIASEAHPLEAPSGEYDTAQHQAGAAAATPGRRSFKDHVEDHPLIYLLGVAVTAFSMGIAVGFWARDGWDAAVQRSRAPVTAPSSNPVAPSPTSAAQP